MIELLGAQDMAPQSGHVSNFCGSSRRRTRTQSRTVGDRISRVSVAAAAWGCEREKQKSGSVAQHSGWCGAGNPQDRHGGAGSPGCRAVSPRQWCLGACRSGEVLALSIYPRCSSPGISSRLPLGEERANILLLACCYQQGWPGYLAGREVGPLVLICDGTQNLRRQSPAGITVGHDHRAVTVVIGHKVALKALVGPAMREVRMLSTAASSNSESPAIHSQLQHLPRHRC